KMMKASGVIDQIVGPPPNALVEDRTVPEINRDTARSRPLRRLSDRLRGKVDRFDLEAPARQIEGVSAVPAPQFQGTAYADQSLLHPLDQVLVRLFDKERACRRRVRE